jgi:hypothetical protein
MAPPAMAARLAAIDPAALAASLDERGYTTLKLLEVEECRALAALYADDARFRSRVVMQRHAYGQGEYKYLRYPLPSPVQALRTALYPLLAPVANGWRERLAIDGRFPPALDQFLATCHAAGQRLPTPLLLSYGPGDYNRLHQDLYGEHVFPLQATVLLSAPGEEFGGGEFLLVEQRPRMQSKGEVVPLSQGDAVIFAVRERPVASARGYSRAAMRHGVSRLHHGRRMTLGVIFHDAR